MSKSDEQKSATLKMEAAYLQTEATETRATKSHGRAHPTAAAQNPHAWKRAARGGALVEKARTQTAARLRDTGAPTLAPHNSAQRNRRRRKAARPNRKGNTTRRGRRRANQDPSHSGGGGVIREEDTQQKRGRASEDSEDVNPSALHASRPTGGANPQRVRKTSPLGKRFREKTAAGGALHRELRKSKRAFGTRLWWRILGETRLNPSARRVSGPGHEPNQKPTGNPSRTKIRAEIKALNTQRKIPDLEPTQSRCKLEIFFKEI
jgi:hypothetical protein